MNRLPCKLFRGTLFVFFILLLEAFECVLFDNFQHPHRMTSFIRSHVGIFFLVYIWILYNHYSRHKEMYSNIFNKFTHRFVFYLISLVIMTYKAISNQFFRTSTFFFSLIVEVYFRELIGVIFSTVYFKRLTYFFLDYLHKPCKKWYVHFFKFNRRAKKHIHEYVIPMHVAYSYVAPHLWNIFSQWRLHFEA